MPEETIQPSNDVKATALAIAARMVKYADYGDDNNNPGDRKALRKERAAVICEIAKQLCDAVKD